MTAMRDVENYVLNGSKLWVTNGVHASIFAVLARTDSSVHPPYRGMSVFLVEKATPGLSVSRTFEKLGYKGVETAELVFDAVHVPAANLLGGIEGEAALLGEAGGKVQRSDGGQRAGGEVHGEEGLLEDEVGGVGLAGAVDGEAVAEVGR